MLTNKNKLAGFIRHLETSMVGLDADIVKNYEILILLLKQIQANDVEVKQTQTGMDVKFNKSSLQKQ